jgi:hypothetical protein
MVLDSRIFVETKKDMKKLKFKKDSSISHRNLNEMERVSLWMARTDVRNSRNAKNAKDYCCKEAVLDMRISYKLTPSGNFEFFINN